MTLYMIGIGLGDEKDITLRGIERIQSCSTLYLEAYTNVPGTTLERLEDFFKKKIIIADRSQVEERTRELLHQAISGNVAFLVIGDVFTATTHIDIFLEAKKKNIQVEVIHNAGIFNAITITGLSIYKFGHTTSIPFPRGTTRIDTPYDVIQKNKSLGLHTLVLLDLDPFQDHYLTIHEALRILLATEHERKEHVLVESDFIVCCARLGTDNVITYGSIKNLLALDYGKPPYCIVIPGTLHFMEEEVLQLYSIQDNQK
jgi:diphthine synthase